MNDKLKTWSAVGAGIVVGILFVFACFTHTVNVAQPGEVKVVGTGSIFGRQDTQKADVAYIGGTSSTPQTGTQVLCALQNTDPDNTDRITDKLQIYLEDTSSTLAGATYKLYSATSTSATATTTNWYNGWNGLTITTSTLPLNNSTSTFTLVNDKRLKANEYQLFIVQPALATTGGFCKQVYDKTATQAKY